MANNTDYEIPSYMVKPPTLGRWEAVRKGIWDSDTKQFMGRTASSWGGILIFYFIFYAALAVLFAICMQGLFLSMNDDAPTWQREESLIGNNPGMGFRPISKDVETAGSLIWYVANDSANIKEWTKNLDEFLEPYKKKGGSKQVICDYNMPPQKDEVCKVDVNAWDPCTSRNSYGFNNSQPCFYIKLNKIYGWTPEFYNDSNNLPKEMPDHLKNHIKSINDTEKLNTVWVSCHGENPADRENIGELQYIPESHGFAGFYYPYTNKFGYLSPLVAVQMLRPKLNVLINIECRAWAKNIRYARIKAEREGSVHLEVMID